MKIIDNFLPADRAEEMYQMVMNAEYNTAPYYDFEYTEVPKDNYFLSKEFASQASSLMDIEVNSMRAEFISRTCSKGSFDWHVDQMRNGEKITVLYYINKVWDKKHGALLEFRDGTLIEPVFNRLVLIDLKKQQLHRVTKNTSNNCRYALTGWLL